MVTSSPSLGRMVVVEQWQIEGLESQPWFHRCSVGLSFPIFKKRRVE